tara:strand:- start:348 stop:536 length:189 start_codon:yes stop_codon:yes gene_type:complete
LYRTQFQGAASSDTFLQQQKKERLFAPLLIIPFKPAKIAVVSFGDGKGSEEFHKAYFHTPLV